ncbi:MAG: NAD(P)-binding domain-containing protein [Rhodopseudomonas palustris]|nr:NAD(P)-binding domain-containing protein [Rhodopseudomonas palustris]
MIGLGRMGANIVPPPDAGWAHHAVVYDEDPQAVAAAGSARARTGAASLERIWSHQLAPAARGLDDAAGRRHHRNHRRRNSARCCRPATSSIDGGNSYFAGRHPARRRSSAERGIHYLDVGTSGGVWGLERGYCLMIGGDQAAGRAARSGLRARWRRARRHRRARQAVKSRRRRQRRTRLSALRPGRRRALRQDGAQRHRVRPDAGLRRGLRHPARTRSAPNAARRDQSLRLRPRRHRRGLAARQRDPLLAARPDRRRRWRATPTLVGLFSGFVRGFRRGTLDDAAPRSTKPVPAEVLTAALFARFRSRQEHTFAEKVARPRCARASAATWSRQQHRRRRRNRPSRPNRARTNRAWPRAPPAASAPDRCAIVIFGATGDLTRRKLIPALYHLA